jgi:GT2 family glycosyltransferase
MPSLTVGILSLNQAAMTMQLLDQLILLAEAGWDIQLIVVDNGSNDFHRLTQWFRINNGRFAEALIVGSSSNLGVAGGRNVILKLSTCEAILFLDNDLILPADQNWLNILWQRLEADPEVAIVGPMLVFSDYPEIVQAAGGGLTANGRVGFLHRGDPVEMVPVTPVEVVTAPAACWLLRTEAQRTVGLFSEDYNPMQYEDVDYSVRLQLKGWKIVCERGARIVHIEHVTTKNIPDRSFERLTARHAMRFREHWADVLPEIATIQQEDIYWGPIPRVGGDRVDGGR